MTTLDSMSLLSLLVISPLHFKPNGSIFYAPELWDWTCYAPPEDLLKKWWQTLLLLLQFCEIFNDHVKQNTIKTHLFTKDVHILWIIEVHDFVGHILTFFLLKTSQNHQFQRCWNSVSPSHMENLGYPPRNRVFLLIGSHLRQTNKPD